MALLLCLLVLVELVLTGLKSVLGIRKIIYPQGSEGLLGKRLERVRGHLFRVKHKM